jgi:hypothetical protein
MADNNFSQTMNLGFTGAFSITNLETDRPIGMMADVSVESMKLTTWKALKPDSIFNLRLRLPEVNNGSIFIVFNAKCLWCKQGADEHSFIAELAFESTTQINMKRIRDLLVSLGKVQTVTTPRTEQ